MISSFSNPMRPLPKVDARRGEIRRGASGLVGWRDQVCEGLQRGLGLRQLKPSDLPNLKAFLAGISLGLKPPDWTGCALVQGARDSRAFSGQNARKEGRRGGSGQRQAEGVFDAEAGEEDAARPEASQEGTLLACPEPAAAAPACPDPSAFAETEAERRGHGRNGARGAIDRMK